MLNYSDMLIIKSELQNVLAKHFCTYSDAETILRGFLDEVVERGKSFMISPSETGIKNSDK